MKITNVDQQKNAVIFTVEVDKNLWQKSFKKAMADAAKNIRIEGFRPGKTPLNLVEKRINRGDVYQKAANNTINEVLINLEESPEFKNDKYELLDRPSVDIKNVNDDELTLSFSYDIMPKVTIKDYSQLELNWDKHKVVEDKDVDHEANAWLQSSKKLLDVTDRSLAKDDIAIIDFVGSIDGVEFLGGKGENFSLKIGSKQFIDNFEDQLIGMNINDSKTITVKFPKDYHAKEYANKKADFKVDLKAIKKEDDTKLDDDFVKSLNLDDVKTVKEFKDYIKKHLQERNNSILKTDIQKDLLLKLIELVELDYIPKGLLFDEKRRIEQIFMNRLKEQKTNFNKYLKDNNLKVEDVNKVIEQDAINSIKYALAIEKIADDNKLNITDEDYKSYAGKLAKLYNLALEDVLDKMKANEEWIKEDLLNDRVIDHIIAVNVKNLPAKSSKKDKEGKEEKPKTTKTATKIKSTTKTAK